jgi:hypothetical protein
MSKSKSKKRERSLSDYEYLELKEYTPKELGELFTAAIYNMAADGILTPKDAKEYLSNIHKWLQEELGELSVKQKFFQTKEFKLEQRKQYKRLREDGFKDTETLKDIETNNVNKQVLKVNFEQVLHFQKCSIYFHTGEIKDKTDLLIFEKYCEGKSNAEISKLIMINFKNIDTATVDRRLKRILIKAGIEPYRFTF